MRARHGSEGWKGCRVGGGAAASFQSLPVSEGAYLCTKVYLPMAWVRMDGYDV